MRTIRITVNSEKWFLNFNNQSVVSTDTSVSVSYTDIHAGNKVKNVGPEFINYRALKLKAKIIKEKEKCCITHEWIWHIQNGDGVVTEVNKEKGKIEMVHKIN
jgi:hypothetical protein